MPTLRLLAAALVALAASLPAQSADPRTDRIREYLVAAATLGHVNGSVLVAERGKVLVDTAFGYANFELGMPSTPDTRFRVASVTKQFTALAVMMLAQDGALRLDDPITKWVDSLPGSWSNITIHHLLRHTSGISDYEEWFGGYRTQAYSDYMSQEHAPARIVRDARARPLDHLPGTKFHYSNSAYILLGYIIERASGMPYERFLAQRIHQPLGMAVSEQDRSEVIIANRAQGYRLREGAMRGAFYNGLVRSDFLNAVYQKMEPPQADAGLITTARDLYKWDQALYTERLLPKAALDSIFTPGLGNYGYGWFINQGADGVTHEHSGGLPGFTCYIMRIPGTQRTIIVLGNVPYVGRTVRDIATILGGGRVATPMARHVVPTDSARESRWTGTYRTATGDSVQVAFEDGALVAQQPGKFRALLLPEVDGGYFAPQLGGVTRFSDASGTRELVVVDDTGAEIVRGKTSRTQVVMLGTGTPIPDPARTGPAVAIVVDSVAYLFDAGTGVVRRAAEAGGQGVRGFAGRTVVGQPAVSFDRVFLTHLHSDHTLGLADVIFTPWIQGRVAPLDIYGPPGTARMVRGITDGNAPDIAERLSSSGGPSKNGWNAVAHEIGEGEVFRDARITVRAFRVPHAGWENAFGYRVETPDRVIVISGDTRNFPPLADQCNGCDILIHEVYSDSGFANMPPLRQLYHAQAHTSATQLGDLATRARPKLLILYHQLFFGASNEQLLREVRSRYRGTVVSAKDLDVY